MSNFKGRTKLDLWKNEGYFWINVIKEPSTSWFIKISIHQKKTRLEPFNNKIYWKSLSNKSGLAFANQIWKPSIIIILEVGVISLSLKMCRKAQFPQISKDTKRDFQNDLERAGWHFYQGFNELSNCANCRGTFGGAH